VFLEDQSVVHGKIYSTPGPVAGLECRVVSIPTGNAVSVAPSSMSTSYDVGGRRGHSVLEFTIRENGNYEFACGYGGNSPGPEAVVAVGSGVGEGIFRTVGVSLVAAFVSVGMFLAVVVPVLVVRYRAG
jgi:hypothetical protein